MRYIITILLFIFSFQINFSQNQTIESNLSGLVLEVGDTFMPESIVKNFDERIWILDWSKNSPFSTFSKRTLTAPCEYA